MNWTPFLTIVGSLAVPTLALVTYLIGKRHRETTETRDSVSQAFGTLSSANEAITETMMSLLTPLRDEISRVSVALDATRVELATTKADLAGTQRKLHQHTKQLTSIRQYCADLREQILRLGSEPPAPPPDVILDPFADILTGQPPFGVVSDQETDLPDA